MTSAHRSYESLTICEGMNITFIIKVFVLLHIQLRSYETAAWHHCSLEQVKDTTKKLTALAKHVFDTCRHY